MGKLYYRYGSMNSSKTANLLMVAYNYRAQGKRVLCMKPAIDTRWGAGKIISRVGIETDCILIGNDANIFEEVAKDIDGNGKLHCVLVDEAQFLKKEHIKQLADVADKLKVPVVCYGLKNTYQDGVLFEGSAALLYYAESIEEIKTVCNYCTRKAIMNLRVKNGKPCYDGESAIQLGDTAEGEDYYIQTCREHYYNPPLNNK